MLLQKRDHRPRRFPGRWAVFGGGIQPGESAETSACREMQEELGLSLTPPDLEGEGLALFTHDEMDYLHLRCHDRIALERHFQGNKFGFLD